MNRRTLLRSSGALIAGVAAGALSAGAVVTATPAHSDAAGDPASAPSNAADPIMEAIACHRAVDDTINTMTGDEPEWEGMLASEALAYEAVCEIVPTTLDGICRKAAYMARVGVYGIPPDQLNVALSSLATAAASLGRAAS